MLMMNPQPGAPASGSMEAAPPSGGPPRAAPGKLKGTMVGVAPAAAGAAPPPQDWAPAAAPEWNQAPAPGAPVNPLGGTLAADNNQFGAPPNPDPYAATAAPPQDWQQQAQGGAYGAPPAAPADQWGQQAPAGGGYGAPPAAPADQWGQAPQAPAQDQQQWGQPAPAQDQQQWGQAPGAVGADAWGQAAGAAAGAAGAVDQWGQQAAAGVAGMGGGMVPYDPNQQMMGGGGGGGGNKGQVRNGLMVLLIGMVTCGIYQLIWFFSVAGEVNRFLGRDAMPAGKILLLSMVTCNLYGLYWQITECGKVIQEVQQRAGIANAQNHGFMYLIPYYNVILMQDELNKAWQAP